MRDSVSQSWWIQPVQIVDERRAGVDVSGVDLQQASPGIEHRLTIVAAQNAADADDGQAGVCGQEAYDLTRSCAEWCS